MLSVKPIRPYETGGFSCVNSPRECLQNSFMIHRKLACHCHCSYLIGFAAIAKMLIKIAQVVIGLANIFFSAENTKLTLMPSERRSALATLT